MPILDFAYSDNKGVGLPAAFGGVPGYPWYVSALQYIVIMLSLVSRHVSEFVGAYLGFDEFARLVGAHPIAEYRVLMYGVFQSYTQSARVALDGGVTTGGALLVEGAYYAGASNQRTWIFMLIGNGAGKYIGECKDITGFLHIPSAVGPAAPFWRAHQPIDYDFMHSADVLACHQ